ncbi:hypothetical protein V8J88_03760 [Massilia sp. W12]|uniref:hypothetical protein n=1 Tax=Massilia sp. W12 TaxID=3126507 RepID=UPI0030D23056
MKKRHLIKKSVMLFVDLNAQMHNANANKEGYKDVRKIETVMKYIEDRIFTHLKARGEAGCIYHIDVRMYYGWFSGKTKVSLRKAFEENKFEQKIFYDDENRSSIIFKKIDIATCFGDKLLVPNGKSLDKRLIFKIDAHLVDTCRNVGGEWREKMVDSAMVCDILTVARNYDYDLIRVMTEDDDIIPALFVADSLGGDIRVLSTREHQNKYLKIDDLISHF